MSKQKILINTLEEAGEWFGKEVVPGTKPIKSGVDVGVPAAKASLINTVYSPKLNYSEPKKIDSITMLHALA